MKKGILIFAAAFTLLSGCTPNVTKEQLENASYGHPPTAYKATINDYLDGSLKDPESKRVKYAGEPKKGHWYYSGDKFGYFVCATVNAKNSYGGYAGKSAYFFGFQDNQMQAVFSDDEYLSTQYINCMCAQKPINSITLSCK
ncbi:hypothetical protein [Neptunomonas japonica]|uniref:hypothetical protein n=1 Tax=Neptunomonas japonica TaxID=417574 RepID=UPI00041FE7F4|nr:hypothetical protein [Neptunomonas japonica]